MLLLSACQTVASESVLPDLYIYGPAVQKQAADEMLKQPPPCPRDVVTEKCCATCRLIMDYGDVRNQIRAIGEASRI